MAEPTADKAPKERKPRKPRKATQPPPEADKAPRAKAKSGAAKRADKRGRELRTIEAGLGELLSFPAMPAAAFGDAWAVDHFSERGPALAARITAECERNERLRGMVLKLIEGQSYMMLAIELGLYAAPPLMHYGIIPGAERAGVPVLGRSKPPADSSHGARQAPQRPAGAPQSAPAAANGAEPAASPQEALEDEDELISAEFAARAGEVPRPAEPPPVDFA